MMSCLILVEGESDRIALEVFARRLRMPPPLIMPIGGAHAVARVTAELRARSPRPQLVGLVDIGERQAFASAVELVFTCDRDLEDELIRALGAQGALAVIAAQDELNSFRRLQLQPAQRDREIVDQLRQFLHGRSGNKARYARLFAEAIPINRIPAPIMDVLNTANQDSNLQERDYTGCEGEPRSMRTRSE